MFGIFEAEKVESSKKPAPKVTPIEPKKEINITGELCPSCGKPLIVRRNSTSKALFVGCSAWPSCKQETYDVGEHISSSRGFRGHATLSNGLDIFYAENFTALRGYGRGVKNGSIGIVKKNKKDEGGYFFWDNGYWIPLVSDEDSYERDDDEDDDDE